MTNRAIIGIGSNSGKKSENVIRAIAEIRKQIHIVKHSSCYETEAVGKQRQEPYCNCVAIIETVKEYDELKQLFKKIECASGRTPKSKTDGIIPLDIDIVSWNDEIIKAADMEQEYMKKGLKEISF